MYLEHYGLKEPPFSITPDPRFVFLSERHRDALAHLLFGIDKGGGGGFVQLTGEVGTGKTTLCRLLLEQLPEHARVALVLNPRLSPVELLETICEELHLDLGHLDGGKRGSIKALVDTLNKHLLEAYAQGLRVVLIIDEAQNLSVDALEQVRLLTNLETDTQKLLQIILLGQPELRDMLARPELRQLAQRITARYHLTPLSGPETEAYLRHRYAIAGGLRFPFEPAAVRRIHAHSGGVPRLTNVIAERALLAGYAHEQAMLDARMVDRAAREALPPIQRRAPRSPMSRYALAAVAVAACAMLALWFWPGGQLKSRQSPVAPVAARPATAMKPARTPTPRLDAAAFAQRIATSANTTTPGQRRLLQLWNAPANVDPADVATCPPALAPGLYCLHGRGSLDALVAQARPMLLHLRAEGHETRALLLGTDAIHARLLLGEATVDVSRLLLARHWQGEYTALFRAPDGMAGTLPSNAQGSGVEWVHARLPDYDGPALLDAGMAQAIRAFQQAHGIAADGVVGPETLMALAVRDEGPRLQRTLD
jgi:general secretion pathway protein A